MAKRKTVEEQIDALARMVKQGFDETASKRDIGEVRGDISGMKGDIHKLGEQIGLIADNQDLTQADIQDIKRTLGPLVRATAEMEVILRGHDKRIERLERKAGLGR